MVQPALCPTGLNVRWAERFLQLFCAFTHAWLWPIAPACCRASTLRRLIQP